MSEPVLKHSRMPRKLSRLTLRRREKEAIGGVHVLSEVDPQAVIQRYLAGETIKNMAAQYGVSRIGMYHFLLRNCPDDWMAAQKARAFAMKEGGEELIVDAQDPLELGKGREQLRAGQWDLERVARKEYGRDEPQVTINMIDLGDRLRRAKERVGQVVEGEITSAPRVNLARAPECRESDTSDAALHRVDSVAKSRQVA